MEACTFCGTPEIRMPFVGIDGQHQEHLICVLCQQQPARRPPTAKMHYFKREEYQRRQLSSRDVLDQITQGAAPTQPPNATKIAASLYFPGALVEISAVEVAALAKLRTLDEGLRGLDTIRAYWPTDDEPWRRTRIFFEATLHAVYPLDMVEMLLASLAPRVDTQVWAVIV